MSPLVHQAVLHCPAQTWSIRHRGIILNLLHACRRNFRDSESKFRQMGALKPKMVLRIFEQLGFQTIVLADTDTVWLRDPESMLLML